MLELSSLNGSNGFVINGDKERDSFGNSVANAGDLNGDGAYDLMISAKCADPTLSRADAGRTYVVYGSKSRVRTSVLETSRLNGRNGFVINGDAKDDQSGFPISTIGDFNNDGIDDLIIGARGSDPLNKKCCRQSLCHFW